MGYQNNVYLARWYSGFAFTSTENKIIIAEDTLSVISGISLSGAQLTFTVSAPSETTSTTRVVTAEYKYPSDHEIRIQGFKTNPDGLPSTLRLSQSGVNVFVANGVSSITIDLNFTESDTDYGVIVTPSWATTTYVQNKTTTQFDVGFGTVAPSDAYIDWFVYRQGL